MTAAAFVAGLQTGEGTPQLLQSILGISGRLTENVTRAQQGVGISTLFAVFLGVAAAFNPCGFVMLPTYLTLYISDGRGMNASDSSTVKQLGRGVLISSALGAGFIALFGTVGAIFALGAEGLTRSGGQIFPWLGFGLGIILPLMGAYILAGGKIYAGAPQSYAGKIGNVQERTLKGYFLFGISYALASLSCTLPLFLGLISTSLSSGGFLNAMIQFISYGLGMTAVITVLTLALAFFKGGLVSAMRRIIPYITPISAIMLIAVGAYLIFYWMTEGGLASRFTFSA